MARATVASIPREFEVTRQFESQTADEADLKSLHDKLFSTDTDSDVRMVLGKSLDQLAEFRIRITWARFGEFVQSIEFDRIAGSTQQSTGPVMKSEVTKRYSASPEG